MSAARRAWSVAITGLVALAALVIGEVPAAAQPSRGAAPSTGPARRVAPAPVPGATARSSERSRLSIEPAGHAITRLSIENPLGDVKVEGYDGAAIQIETHKFAPDDDALDRLHI